MSSGDGRPNFLLIMTDQHRGDCLSLADHPKVLTPNIDHIGGNGVHFRQAYSTCPSCIAARRSLMTGQFLTDARARWLQRLPGMGRTTHAAWGAPHRFSGWQAGLCRN